MLLITAMLGVWCLYAQKTWQHYYDKIPQWPEDLTVAVVEKYTSALIALDEELGAHLENASGKQQEAFDGMSVEEAMQMAARYQEQMLENSAIEMAERFSQEQAALSEAIVLDQKLEGAIQHFQKEFQAGLDDIHRQYPCEMGMESSTDRCDERSAALKKLGIGLQAAYFSGERAEIRLAVNSMQEYIYKKSLPSTLQKEQEQLAALGVDPPAGNVSAIELVRSDVKMLLRCADLMGWVGGIRSDDNLFFYPGQRY